MSELIVSISGIRGIVGETITPQVVTKYALAFGSFLKGKKKVIVGKDTRITGDMVKNAVVSGLLATGCEVVDIGIAPTPTVQYLTKKLKFDGGIVITASHNPIQWNALKFYKQGGLLFENSDYSRLKGYLEKGQYNLMPWNKYRTVSCQPQLGDIHIKQVLDSLNFITRIKKKRFKVALDSCNASGSFITPKLLNILGCRVDSLYTEPDGYFPHNPEPNKDNLKEIMRFMKKSRFDIGFAQDSDADRLAVLDEKGNFTSEEHTLALAVYYVLSLYDRSSRLKKFAKSVVVNLSTSRMVDDIARPFQAKVIRTPVGEKNVAQSLIRSKSVIGGEGNGGVIFPLVNYGRDSLAGIGLVLDLLAFSGKKLSDLLNEMPSYVMLKTKFNIQHLDVKTIIPKIVKDFSKGKIDRRDGVKCDFDDFWFHIRASNTEPIVRLVIEARNDCILQDTIKSLKNYFK